MKILVGVTGLGNGHTLRQAVIIEALLMRGHELALFVYSSSKTFFDNSPYRDKLKRFEIRTPIIPLTQTGIDFGLTAQLEYNHMPDVHQVNFAAMQSVLDAMGRRPDLVISDYEMVSAQFAYATGSPLITVDQQSKFAGFQLPEAGNLSRAAEQARLNMFFPRADARFACSFFEVTAPPDPTYPVEVIPPILRPEVLALSPDTFTEGKTVVYLSPHVELEQSLDEFVEIYQQFPERQFIVFQKNSLRQEHKGNVRLQPIDPTTFLEVLASADSVICTAGHNLISELVYLQKPLLTIPAQTYDQQLCADIVAAANIGQRHSRLDAEALENFISKLGHYRQNMKENPMIASRFDGADLLIERLHQEFGV